MTQPQATPQTTRPMVMWRVTMRCRHGSERTYAAGTEIVDVEAPENDLYAAAHAGVQRLYALGFVGAITRVDVALLEGRTPPSRIAAQPGLWDTAESEAQP